MIDTGCPHPDDEVILLYDGDCTLVSWCTLCGSIQDNNGNHGAPAGSWRAPGGVVLPGWTCAACSGFNGSGKELLSTCRGCGVPRGTQPLTSGISRG